MDYFRNSVTSVEMSRIHEVVLMGGSTRQGRTSAASASDRRCG